MIKKLSWMFIILFSAVCMSSCSSDDDGPDGGSVNQALIIGKWQGVASSGWEKEDGKVTDRWSEDWAEYDFIEFRDNATGEWEDEDGRKKSFTWYLNDDLDLVIGEKYVGDGTGETYKIKTVTKDKLILVSQDDDPDDGWYQEDTYKRIN